MREIIIGIDPGSKGYICILDALNSRRYISLSESDNAEITRFISQIEGVSNVICVMEEVHAIFGSSAKATFSFGEIFGFLKGLIAAHNIPLYLIPPKTWQKEIWINADKVEKYNSSGKKVIDTKNTSINAAKRLFPTEDFRRNKSCKKIDDNKVDATLIAEYARRKNL